MFLREPRLPKTTVKYKKNACMQLLVHVVAGRGWMIRRATLYQCLHPRSPLLAEG